MPTIDAGYFARRIWDTVQPGQIPSMDQLISWCSTLGIEVSMESGPTFRIPKRGLRMEEQRQVMALLFEVVAGIESLPGEDAQRFCVERRP